MKILTIALLLMLFMPFALAAPQPQLELTGKQMIPLHGAPWIGDNSKIYLGNDKDAYIQYNTTTAAAEISGITAVVNTGATIAAGEDVVYAGGDSIFDAHLGSGIFKTTTGAVTIGPGAVGITGDITIAATKGITKTAGAGNFDFSAGSGTFLTPTGAATLSGDTTVASAKTLAVTTSDKLTVGGVIVPQAITIPIRVSASSANGTVFIPISGNYQVVGIQEVHSVAGTDAHAVTGTIVKVTGTQAPATAGVLVMSNTFNLKGTPETIQTGTLTGANNCKVNTTERLGIRFNNPLTSLEGGCISISLQRIA